MAEGVAEGEAWVPLGVGTAKAGLVKSSEVVRVAHVVLPSRECEPGTRHRMVVTLGYPLPCPRPWLHQRPPPPLHWQPHSLRRRPF